MVSDLQHLFDSFSGYVVIRKGKYYISHSLVFWRGNFMTWRSAYFTVNRIGRCYKDSKQVDKMRRICTNVFL